ncbi:MAG: hypothetical protein PWP27_172 [Clostridiales bacterium]|nr:hypothetical protein [Clostridiales bacterium]
MTIKLNKLTLKNFKGIRNFTLEVNGKNAFIYGDNEAGKTSIFDAFVWLLFDKDSSNRSNFQIKTLDSTGNVIHGLEHEVEGHFSVDGTELILKKVYQEKWTRRRGESEKIFTGHETNYWINDVPVKKNEYVKKIDELVNENIFKLLANPLYFNTFLKWQDRREILLKIIGDIEDSEVINSNAKLKDLSKILGDRSIEDYKKVINERKKKLNKEIEQIPIRIDEINNNLPELDSDVNYTELEKEKKQLLKQILDIESEITAASNITKSLREKEKELYRLREKRYQLEKQIEKDANREVFELQKKQHEIKFNIKGLKNNIELDESSISRIETDIKNYESKLAELRKEYGEIYKEQFANSDKDNFICPTCSQKLPDNDIEARIEELKKNFVANKQRRLDEINKTGKSVKKLKESLEKKLDNLKTGITLKNEHLAQFEKDYEKTKAKLEELSNNTVEIDYSSNKEYMELTYDIDVLEAELSEPVENETNALLDKKSQLNKRVDEINSILNNKEAIEKSKVRIKELEAQERDLAKKLNELEKHEFLIETFIRTKVDLLESKINENFKYVNFKLFDTQVNGATSECCETLIKGVPFNDANNAAKINAGIDIINTLTEFYDISVPIFIDNRESVNNLIETNSQVINLVVSKDKNLKVEVM